MMSINIPIRRRYSNLLLEINSFLKSVNHDIRKLTGNLSPMKIGRAYIMVLQVPMDSSYSSNVQSNFASASISAVGLW